MSVATRRDAAAPAVETREEDHAGAASALLAAAIGCAAARLMEPPVPEPRRALRLVEPLAETLAGFAVGTIADVILGHARRWFGGDIARAVNAEIVRKWPSATDRTGPDGRPMRYLADAEARPLVDDLAARLHVRLCRAAPDVRALIALVTATIARVAPARADATTAMLRAALRDDLIGDRVVGEIEHGWLVYRAAVAAAAPPSSAGRSPRSEALWDAWWWKVAGARGGAARPAPERAAPERAGYIMLVQ